MNVCILCLRRWTRLALLQGLFCALNSAVLSALSSGSALPCIQSSMTAVSLVEPFFSLNALFEESSLFSSTLFFTVSSSFSFSFFFYSVWNLVLLKRDLTP